MTKEEKYTYWLELAQYDLDTATAMFSAGRWFYVVFMCQQAVEKLCKGLYTIYLDDNVPKIHNIKTVLSRFKDKLPTTVSEDILHFLDSLSAQYITYRYPDFEYKPDRLTSKSEAKQILEKTKEVFSWLLTLKP
ncbi:MAG: HEPN domain-containing protein [Treponema sp.]|jgi:HEPN domain-containing protein|nr:HEPN domain-containing protein [Treponema sp.]